MVDGSLHEDDMPEERPLNGWPGFYQWVRDDADVDRPLMLAEWGYDLGRE